MSLLVRFVLSPSLLSPFILVLIPLLGLYTGEQKLGMSSTLSQKLRVNSLEAFCKQHSGPLVRARKVIPTRFTAVFLKIWRHTLFMFACNEQITRGLLRAAQL